MPRTIKSVLRGLGFGILLIVMLVLTVELTGYRPYAGLGTYRVGVVPWIRFKALFKAPFSERGVSYQIEGGRAVRVHHHRSGWLVWAYQKPEN